MRALTAPLYELSEFEEIRKLLKKPGKYAALTGCVESQKLHMAYGLSEGLRCRLIVTFSDQRMKELQEDYRFYDRNTTCFPARDARRNADILAVTSATEYRKSACPGRI